LRALHEVVQPRTYFEIGVHRGMSLTRSRVPSVGVDPAFLVDRELHCDVHLVRATSDEFFARRHPFAHFTGRESGPVVDLAFIDGMHLAEYCLRDFVNTEKWCRPGSVIVIDDMLPRTAEEAGRGREDEEGAWAGDVYKVTAALRSVRPDLVVHEVDTEGTGVVMVLLPDPDDRTLLDAYDGLAREFVVPDPQQVPADVVGRARALDPDQVVSSTAWARVAELRDTGRDDSATVRAAYASGGLL
jgi:hypothetical protein